MDTTFGIDFGTTNSALAVYKGGKVEVIDIDEYSSNGKTMRSVLYFDEEGGIYVGQQAIAHYVNDGASGRFMQSTKTFLPSQSLEHTYVYGRRYEVSDLIAIILRRIKEKGEAYTGEKVERVVMGRPAVFSKDPERDALAQSRLEEAARRAGFKDVQFQFEPVAAALTFEQTIPAGEERKVLIGDFGGGTSDFTVIRLRGGISPKTERRSDVLSMGGVYVGGDAFDSQVMWEKVTKYFGRLVKYRTMTGDTMLDMPVSIMRTLCQWHLIPHLRDRKVREAIRQIKYSADDPEAVERLENLIADNYGFMLFQAIEKAKCELSSLEQSRIAFKERDLVIREEMTRSEFEEINLDNIAKLAKCIDETVASSGLSFAQVDSVFITGGTSHIPAIQRLFLDRFSPGKMNRMDAFTSVVHGLGASVPFLF